MQQQPGPVRSTLLSASIETRLAWAKFKFASSEMRCKKVEREEPAKANRDQLANPTWLSYEELKLAATGITGKLTDNWLTTDSVANCMGDVFQCWAVIVFPLTRWCYFISTGNPGEKNLLIYVRTLFSTLRQHISVDGIWSHNSISALAGVSDSHFLLVLQSGGGGEIEELNWRIESE